MTEPWACGSYRNPQQSLRSVFSWEALHFIGNRGRTTGTSIAYLVIGANGSVRGKKVTSLARWPPNPSRCWALTWRTIGPMEDYWARSGGLLAEWPLSTSGGVFPLTRLTTDA